MPPDWFLSSQTTAYQSQQSIGCILHSPCQSHTVHRTIWSSSLKLLSKPTQRLLASMDLVSLWSVAGAAIRQNYESLYPRVSWAGPADIAVVYQAKKLRWENDADSSPSSAWGIMWDCSAVCWTYLELRLCLWQVKKNRGFFPFFVQFVVCTRLSQSVTALQKHLKAPRWRKSDILLLWNSPILTAKSWSRACGGTANKTWMKNE